jgi:redox-sensitive bicupin YhaK (pirin superfamily)
MKFFTLIAALLIGIASILYKSQLIDIASTFYRQYSDSNTTTSSTTTTLLQQDFSSSKTTVDNINPTGLYQPNQEQLDMSVHRAIRKVFLAVEQAEGQGARVRRSIGTPQLRNFSPFLMLDHFSIKPPAGFPDHPHRGQETITYLINGGVDHEDFAGNKGTINSGDLQFMTAGRGIVHAEMPRDNPDGSANVGLQLWVDLPEKLKACEPRYRDLRAEEIPSTDAVDNGRVSIKVISGQSHGIDSVKDLAYTPVWILDFTIRPGGQVTQPLPKNWNAFGYVLEGEVRIGEEPMTSTPVKQYNNVVFEQEGDMVTISAAPDASGDARIILIAGTPLDQEVVQYGPFVLTSKEEVYQALFDYQSHANGFERAKDWQSDISRALKGR